MKEFSVVVRTNNPDYLANVLTEISEQIKARQLPIHNMRIDDEFDIIARNGEKQIAKLTRHE